MDMPEEYSYYSEVKENIKNRFIIKNGLSQKSYAVDGKQYYRLFENEENKVSGLAGYIRKEGHIIYLLPFYCGLENAQEQVFIDFNSVIGDTISIMHGCQPIDTIKLILKNIHVESNDSIYLYQIIPTGCDDCTRLKYLSVGLKSGFKSLYFENSLTSYSLTLTSKELKFKEKKIIE